MPEEEVREPSEPGHNHACCQPCPEEMQGILEVGMEPQDLPAGALPLPGVVDDVSCKPALLIQRELGADASFCLRLRQPIPPHEPGELRPRAAARMGGWGEVGSGRKRKILPAFLSRSGGERDVPCVGILHLEQHRHPCSAARPITPQTLPQPTGRRLWKA